MDDALFQLVFVAIAFVIWIIQTASERKKRTRKPRPQPRSPAPEDGAPGPAEPRPPVARRRPPAPAPETRRPPAPAYGRPALSPLEVPRERRVAATVRRRLGLGEDTTFRNAARRGILWQEILGPPRALRGPHRSPRGAGP